MIRSICDLSDDHPGLAQTAAPLFQDYGARRVFHGPIATLRCHEDNLLLRRTLSTPGEGRVMVVDGGGSLRRALVGDKLGALLLQNGWAGIIVNGAARDVETLRTMPVAVRAIAVCPTRPGQLATGDLDVVLEFAGVVFRPGEWLYADENGIIVSATPLA
jgi:regulator of ribonuclease activity A